MDLLTEAQARKAKAAMQGITDLDWNYDNAWNVGHQAAHNLTLV